MVAEPVCPNQARADGAPDETAPRLFTARVSPGDAQCDAWSHEPLLTALEMGSLDWPSSCRNGTCRTCIGRLVSGSVRYTIDWPGLSAEEKQAGCVLPCVAYPCGDVVLRRDGG